MQSSFYYLDPKINTMKTIFFLLFFCSCSVLQAQSLELKEQGNNLFFMAEDQFLSKKELRILLKTHKPSWISYRKVQRKSLIGIIVGVPSMAVIGSEIGRWSGGGSPNWTAIALGGVGTGVGLFLNKNKKQKLREIVRKFNLKNK